jgi:hypothetical protein
MNGRTMEQLLLSRILSVFSLFMACLPFVLRMEGISFELLTLHMDLVFLRSVVALTFKCVATANIS